MKDNIVECTQEGKCFARSNRGHCRILKDGYEEGKCPFQKPYREVTNGVYFPINEKYVCPNETAS